MWIEICLGGIFWVHSMLSEVWRAMTGHGQVVTDWREG
jgi:hypothetical protein